MRTIIIELHGLSESNITKEDAPFICSLKKRFHSAKLKPPFGSNIFASVWTGENPAGSGYFTKYYYDPKNNLKQYWLFPGRTKDIIYNIAQVIKGRRYYTKIDSYPKIKNFQIMKKHHYFEKGFFKGETIFDILKEKKTPFLFYEHPVIATSGHIATKFFGKGNNLARIKKFSTLLKDNLEADFCFLMLRDTDQLGHRFGPNSKEVKECLRKTDKELKDMLKKFSTEDDAIFVMAGYGMLEVSKYLDLEKTLPKFGDGYIYFLDSTMARFWFFDEKKKKEVMDILSKIKEGHVLSKKEIKEYGIDFRDKKFFEEIFLINSGIAISPCFFHDKKVKGMHTYGLKDKKEYGFVVSNQNLKGTIDATELQGIFLKALESTKSLQ